MPPNKAIFLFSIKHLTSKLCVIEKNDTKENKNTARQKMLTNNENFESANQLSLTSNIQQQPNDVHNDKRKIFLFNN